ncbi:hypothetical protein C0Q70_14141 [Pomacea canaliculata]|uniref:Uncharacterized protein n=1 Tax=Pomacea canaliculata TaxID=400727 RepID=A0A2T7NZ62_POMCA|nr:hypothetical protein C0Q70_14141 [Pomacea canaliculata]
MCRLTTFNPPTQLHTAADSCTQLVTRRRVGSRLKNGGRGVVCYSGCSASLCRVTCPLPLANAPAHPHPSSHPPSARFHFFSPQHENTGLLFTCLIREMHGDQLRLTH